MTDSKDADQIIGEAITASLSKMFYKQIDEDGIEPLVIVRSLISVAGKKGGDTRLTCAVEPPLIYIFL